MELSFVGRVAEFEYLTNLLDQASCGQGSIVVVTGEPGVGKTRLVREFAGTVSNGTVIFAGAQEFAHSPLRLWRSIAKAAARKQPGVDTSLFLSHDDDVTDMADLADDVLGLLGALPAPVLVVLEDIHWADQASERLFEHLAPGSAAEPILFVATRRSAPGQVPEEGNPRPSFVLDLNGLSVADMARVLSMRYPQERSSQVSAAATRLSALTGGNPLASFAMILGLERTVDTGKVIVELARATPHDVLAPVALRASIVGMLASFDGPDREVFAAVALAGKGTPHLLSRITLRSVSEVVSSCGRGVTARLLQRMGQEFSVAHPLVGSTLLDELPERTLFEISARYAEFLATASQPDWALAVENAQRSGGLVSPNRTMELADLAGREAMMDLAYEDAERFFAIAAAHDDDSVETLAARTDRLMRRALANVRLGHMETAYELYRSAAENAEILSDVPTLARAAFGFAFPPDWRAGSQEALDLLVRAERALAECMTIDSVEIRAIEIQLIALRSTLEMRIPQTSADGRQWAWIVRADIAQPRAELALELSDECDDKFTRVIALLAWRWTHRGPKFLAQRTRVSREALDLALELNSHQQILEAAVRLVVDHLEAGDRSSANEILAIAEWTNTRARDARVHWRTCGLRAGLAGIDGDWEAFEELRAESFGAGTGAMIPGAVVMDHALRLQRSIVVYDLDYLTANEEMLEYLPLHPLASAGVAYASARMGRIDDAREQVERTFPLLDEESSLLQSLAYMGQAVALTQDKDQATRLLPLMAPWANRVAIDAEALMCSGALGLILADVAAVAGEVELSRSARLAGAGVQQRLTKPGVGTGSESEYSKLSTLLTERERKILQEIANGKTNAEIATALNFSLATVRRDTISIYSKLHVRGRANAVARALELGLVTR